MGNRTMFRYRYQSCTNLPVRLDCDPYSFGAASSKEGQMNACAFIELYPDTIGLLLFNDHLFALGRVKITRQYGSLYPGKGEPNNHEHDSMTV